MPKKKAIQEELPGLEARDVPEIEQAAEHYRAIRDERCELSKQEAEAKAALIQVMKKLGRSFYSYNGLKVELAIKDDVKVKSSESEDDEPVGTFTQPRRKREPVEQQQQAEAEQAEANREAVAEFFDDEASPQSAWEGEDGFHPGFPPGFDPERAEQGLAQVVNLDDFTASRCDKCGRIDGGHTPDCPNNPDSLRFEDYLAYAEAHYKSNHKSHARKMELSKHMDDKVRAWKIEQQAGNGVEAETDEKPSLSREAAQTVLSLASYVANDQDDSEKAEMRKAAEKKKKKRAKLSPVEAAIDR